MIGQILGPRPAPLSQVPPEVASWLCIAEFEPDLDRFGTNHSLTNGKDSKPIPVLSLVCRQVSVLLNRNFSNHFNFGAIKGQRFPLRRAPSQHSVFGFVTISFSTCVYVAGSGEPKAPSLPCTMLLLWMLPASAPRLVPCVALPAAGRVTSVRGAALCALAEIPAAVSGCCVWL